MLHKRPLEAVAPEQGAARSPMKRLMCLERSGGAATVHQMAQAVRQLQSDREKLYFRMKLLLSGLGFMENLILQFPNMIRGLSAAQLGAYRRSLVGSIQDTLWLILETTRKEARALLLVYEPSREISEGLPETGGSSGVVKLRFVDADRPKDPLYTGSPVQWQNGKNAKIAIFRDDKQIMFGDLSKLQIEILPVHADFFTERGQDDFTKEEFIRQIYMYKGKESVFATVNLTNGEAHLGSFFFTESSYSKNLRLAARVKRQDPVDRVQEAVTDPFVVKDRRSELNEKSYLPSKGDAVHRLKKISPKGKRCIVLEGKKINTVKQLMRLYHEDKSLLQKLTGMKKKDWSTMIEHATTCDPGDEIYSYRVAEENFELLFNDLYDLVGIIINGLYVPVRDLDQFQKLEVNNWRMSAYKKFEQRENSGGLFPDYLMINGRPVMNSRLICPVPLNNYAGPSVRARTTWQYPNDMTGQHGASLNGQQNGYLSSLMTDTLGTCPVTELGQHDPSMPQNETPYYRIHENIMNDHGPFSVQPTNPFHSFLAVLAEDLTTGAGLIGQLNGWMERMMDAMNKLAPWLAELSGAFDRSPMGSIEDTIPSVHRTELQEQQVALFPNCVYEPSREISEVLHETGGSSGVVKLRFVDADRPKDPLYTCCPVKWQNGKKAKVAIFNNERQIMQGNLSKLQIEILPVHADFFTERGQEDFTQEEFNKHMHMYKGKDSVLTTVNLRNGEAYLGSFSFTESSYGKKLRLAARVKRQDPSDRVQEAITDPFVVKDRRSELNEKSYPPSKGDAIHRLRKICQKGKRCTILAGKSINTVKHLMRQYHEDKSGLQKLTGMKKKDWSTMIKHATTCDPGDEIYSYRVPEENCELLFNDFYDLVGMTINGLYVAVGDLDQFQQRKVNNWKMTAYKKFEERENSVGLIPDYLMSNGCPARAVPLNNEAGPSVQAKPTWQYPNDMAAQQEFGEQHPFRQQNMFSLATVLSNNDAGPSRQEAPLFPQHTGHQDLGQHSPVPQNGTLYRHTQGNILNGQGLLSAQPTVSSYNFPPVQEDDLITGARVTSLPNLSSSTTHAPSTSISVADGVSLQTSSLDDVQDDYLSWLPLFEEWFEPEAHMTDQGFVRATNELPDSNIQFNGYVHDGGN